MVDHQLLMSEFQKFLFSVPFLVWIETFLIGIVLKLTQPDSWYLPCLGMSAKHSGLQIEPEISGHRVTRCSHQPLEQSSAPPARPALLIVRTAATPRGRPCTFLCCWHWCPEWFLLKKVAFLPLLPLHIWVCILLWFCCRLTPATTPATTLPVSPASLMSRSCQSSSSWTPIASSPWATAQSGSSAWSMIRRCGSFWFGRFLSSTLPTCWVQPEEADDSAVWLCSQTSQVKQQEGAWDQAYTRPEPELKQKEGFDLEVNWQALVTFAGWGS